MIERVAYVRAGAAFETSLRDKYLGRPGVAYAGRAFRVYPHMRVGEAARFFGAIHAGWLGAQLAEDLERLGLGEAFEVRRLKRAYQRAFVLALAAAQNPAHVVVEGAEEFDDERTGALLSRSLQRVPSATVTYAGEAAHAEASLAIRLAPTGLAAA